MKKNATKNIVLIALLQVPTLLTAAGVTFETTIPKNDPLKVTPVLTQLFPGLGYLLKETRDNATKYLPENKNFLFNPIFTHVAQVVEKPIRVAQRYLYRTIDISTGVLEEKVINTIFKETAKDLGIDQKKVEPLRKQLLNANSILRLTGNSYFAGFSKWFDTNRPAILDNNLNQIAPTQYFPYFVTRTQKLKESLAPYTNSEVTLLLSLISAATQSQIKSCQWYFIPELVGKLHKKVNRLPSLKMNKREKAIILNDINDFKKEAAGAHRFILIHLDLLAPACESMPLVKKLSKHKKTSLYLAFGLLFPGMLTTFAATMCASENALPVFIGFAALWSIIFGTTYGIHAATKPKVSIQQTTPATPRVTRQPITA